MRARPGSNRVTSRQLEETVEPMTLREVLDRLAEIKVASRKSAAMRAVELLLEERARALFGQQVFPDGEGNDGLIPAAERAARARHNIEPLPQGSWAKYAILLDYAQRLAAFRFDTPGAAYVDGFGRRLKVS